MAILYFTQYVGVVRGEETTSERNVVAKNNIRNGNKHGHGSENMPHYSNPLDKWAEFSVNFSNIH